MHIIIQSETLLSELCVQQPVKVVINWEKPGQASTGVIWGLELEMWEDKLKRKIGL